MYDIIFSRIQLDLIFVFLLETMLIGYKKNPAEGSNEPDGRNLTCGIFLPAVGGNFVLHC